MIFVTAVNRRYFPGAVALWNSFRRFHNGHEFYCIAYGDEQLVIDLAVKGMNVMHNSSFGDFDCLKLPAPGVWNGEHIDKDALRALYVRMILPELFPDSERVTWIDADSNFIRACAELDTVDMAGKSVAASLSRRKPRIWKAMNKPVGNTNIRTGTILFDTVKYRLLNYAAEMLTFVYEHGDKFDDSTVNCAFNYIVRNDCHDLGDAYSYNAKHGTVVHNARILHWSICEPWAVENKPERIQKAIAKWWEPYA